MDFSKIVDVLYVSLNEPIFSEIAQITSWHKQWGWSQPRPASQKLSDFR